MAPCKINSRNQAKQWSTFTLTNAAPQYPKFNSHTWRIYECVTETSILQLVPNEPVYIITGVVGAAKDRNNQSIKLKNRVLVPGRFWKAVCYPGNGTKEAWGYAIVDENKFSSSKPDPSKYKTLRKFAKEYFADPPFGPECMEASFGEFGKYLFPSQWNITVRNCFSKRKNETKLTTVQRKKKITKRKNETKLTTVQRKKKIKNSRNNRRFRRWIYRLQFLH